MSDLKIKGKIVKILEVEKGTSKAGKEWQKQNFVIDTGSKYNPEICFQLFGDEKIGMLRNFAKGEEVEVSFNVSSREYNGRYFHNLDAWLIKSASAETAPKKQESEPVDDDLPF
jgi:hypothetical protein